jgi:hypothetical protein
VPAAMARRSISRTWATEYSAAGKAMRVSILNG